MNRDTLYSSGIFDLAAAPVTIALPDPGGRYMSLRRIVLIIFSIMLVQTNERRS